MTLVGRDLELDLLDREAALAVELGTGRSVFVYGPPGAGKTTLVTEFLNGLHARRPEVNIARGRCLQTFGSADPYLPFVDALRDLSDESTAGSVAKESLSALVTELAPYWLSVIPMVGSLLSAGFATAAKFRGTPAGEAVAPSREALFVQYLELVQRLAREAPLVLFFDDLHWADHSSIALLNHVSRGIGRYPIFILGTLRSDEEDLEKHPITNLIRELERESLGRGIQLGELEAGALGHLLAAEFGGDVSEPLERWVRETAGGNPLFATELARLLRQSGAAVEVRGEWLLTDAVGELEVPRSAEAVIETRIQRLRPEEIRLMQYASVQGNEFDSVVLSGLLEQDELEVLDALERLERRSQLVSTTGELDLPNGDVTTTLSFRNALVQTVLYRQVLGKRRILLHRKAGELIESLFQGSASAVAGQLARHFHEGRVGDRAYLYAREAADAARWIYAHWEAEELFRIGLDHAPGEAERAEMHERLGDVYNSVGYYERGLKSFTDAFERLSQEPEPSIRIRRKMLIIERKVGRVPAPALLRRLRALAEEAAGIPGERCRILLELAYLPGASGVAEIAEEAVALAESLGEPRLLAEALEQLGVVLIFGGDPAAALPHLERAFEVGRGAEDPLRAARYYNIRGVAHAKLGQYRQALNAFERQLEFCERLANPHFVGTACNNAGAQLLHLGEYGRAEEILQRTRTIHERRDRAMLVQSLLNLAKRAQWSGELDLALERYTEMRERAQEVEYWTSEAVASAGIGLCELARGRPLQAREAAEHAASVVADRDAWFEDREFVEVLFAQLEALDGEPRQAAERLANAAAQVVESDRFAWARVELERVRITRTFDPRAAGEILEEVVAATRGVEFALADEIAALREALSGAGEMAGRTPP